eukprot:COSAG06_NODE_16629_length_990_cov_0.771044_1_plen_99_part_10
MPVEIHPNLNWLRGSRWSWDDGAVDLAGLAQRASANAAAAAAATAVSSGAGGGPAGGWAQAGLGLRYAVFRDDGKLLTAAVGNDYTIAGGSSSGGSSSG